MWLCRNGGMGMQWRVVMVEMGILYYNKTIHIYIHTCDEMK